MQLSDKVCIFLTEVWQARSAWNIPDGLILWLLLRKKIVQCFAIVQEAVCMPWVVSFQSEVEIYRWSRNLKYQCKVGGPILPCKLNPISLFKHQISKLSAMDLKIFTRRLTCKVSWQSDVTLGEGGIQLMSLLTPCLWMFTCIMTSFASASHVIKYVFHYTIMLQYS